MHVAKMTNRQNGKIYVSYLLRRSVRDGDKVKHQTLGNLSHLPLELIDLVRRGLSGEHVGLGKDAFDIVRTRPHGHVIAALGTLRHLELDTLIGSRRSRERDLVEAMIVARILDPRSKLATALGFRSDTLESTLGEILGLDATDEDDLYSAMDWLLKRQSKIEAALARRHLTDGSLILYDVTSTWIEGRHCSLAKLGHSRDGKKHKLQIVYGLLCDHDGCPVAVEVFEGNTGDPKTLAAQIEKVRSRFGLRHVVIVGDRGMITDARIREDLKPLGDIEWITALRSPAIRSLMDEGAIDPSLFDERNMAEITSPDFPGERLIVCRNPILADERTRKRDELLLATEKVLQEIVVATRRSKNRFRGKDRIALRVGRVMGRYKMAKHFKIEIEENSFSYRRDEDSIASEKRLDGFYVIRTNLPESKLSANETVRTYKSLSRVERAFRSMKTVDLKVRPIYHRLETRVRSHVFLCMLAYYVEWNMRKALAPILFDDEERPKPRASPVAPATRSKSALAKARDKQTADETPTMNFQGALRNLRTIARNRIRTKGADAREFDMVTEPTELQSKMLNLLGVSLAL